MHTATKKKQIVATLRQNYGEYMGLFRRISADSPSDEALLARYQRSKDLGVLATLYQQYLELVYGVALKYLQDEGAAADAVMEIYEELIAKAAQHEIRTFQPWLYTLTKNHCLMQLRKKQRSITQTFDPTLMHSLPLLHHEEAGDSAAEEELRKLEQCLAQLTAQQAQCIQLFYYDNKSYQEIATIEGLELGLVRSQLQNGRRNLKKCMNG